MKKTHWTAASMFFLTSGRTGGSRLENSTSHISFHLPPSYPFTKSIPNSNFYSTNKKSFQVLWRSRESELAGVVYGGLWAKPPAHRSPEKPRRQLLHVWNQVWTLFWMTQWPSSFFTEWWRSLRLGSATRTQLATLPPTWPSWRWTSRTAWLQGELGCQAGPHLCLQALLHLYCVTIIIWQVSAHWTEPG